MIAVMVFWGASACVGGFIFESLTVLSRSDFFLARTRARPCGQLSEPEDLEAIRTLHCFFPIAKLMISCLSWTLRQDGIRTHKTSFGRVESRLSSCLAYLNGLRSLLVDCSEGGCAVSFFSQPVLCRSLHSLQFQAAFSAGFITYNILCNTLLYI